MKNSNNYNIRSDSNMKHDFETMRFVGHRGHPVNRVQEINKMF